MRRLLAALTGVLGAALVAYAAIGPPAGPDSPPAPSQGVPSPKPMGAPTEPIAAPRPEPEQASARPADARAATSSPLPRRPDGPWLEIESIGVSTRLTSLKLNPDRSLQVPADPNSAGWWLGGPEPGEQGASVIAGHVDSRSGPAVFSRLHQLRPGAVIDVTTQEGTTARFVVQRTERYDKNRFPTRRVYGSTTGPTLRLVTCAGRFDAARGHYRENLIVFARRDHQ